MALWSVPVYAGIPRDLIVKQYKHYKKAYAEANGTQATTIDHTNIEQLKQDMEKKKSWIKKKITKKRQVFQQKIEDIGKKLDDTQQESERRKKGSRMTKGLSESG